MKRQLLGISIIFFSIMLCFIGANSNFWIYILDYLPWDDLCFILGTIGLIIVIKNSYE